LFSLFLRNLGASLARIKQWYGKNKIAVKMVFAFLRLTAVSRGPFNPAAVTPPEPLILPSSTMHGTVGSPPEYFSISLRRARSFLRIIIGKWNGFEL